MGNPEQPNPFVFTEQPLMYLADRLYDLNESLAFHQYGERGLQVAKGDNASTI